MKKLTVFIIFILAAAVFSFAQTAKLQLMNNLEILGNLTRTDKNILGAFSVAPDIDKQMLSKESAPVKKTDLSPADEAMAKRLQEAYDRNNPQSKYELWKFLDMSKTHMYTVNSVIKTDSCSYPVTTQFFTVPVTVAKNDRREVFYGVEATYASILNVAGGANAAICGFKITPSISASAVKENNNITSKVKLMLKAESIDDNSKKDNIVCNFTISSKGNALGSAGIDYKCSNGKNVNLTDMSIK